MAKVLGQSGRYVSEQVVQKRRRVLGFALPVIILCSALEGFLLGFWLFKDRTSSILHSTLMLGVAVLLWLFSKRVDKKLDALEREVVAMKRGASGEVAVGLDLANFPDEFCVINDLTTPFGNLDHVVVGPTGVFVMDTKNWRGVVAADGKGELLLNDKATNKPFIRQFTARMMGIREKVRLLAPGPDLFYNGVFVFTSARVEAKWGTTGKVNCITDDQLRDYIVEKDFGKRLSKEEVERIAQAFLGLAHIDAQFTRT
jgi:hypothetical protein